MYHGVPVVGVPLFGDHYDTMTRVAAKGMGIMLHWKTMSEEDLFTALAKVIKDTRLVVYVLSLFITTIYLPLPHVSDSSHVGTASKRPFSPPFTKTSQATP